MYEFTGRIRYSEVDGCGLLRPEALINYFQDCSTFQSEDGGVGIGYMKDRDVAWIVNYWQIRVFRYPALSERVIAGTNPYEFKAFMGLRNFYLKDAGTGELLADANSVWSLFDLAKGRPAQVTKAMEDCYTLGPKMEMEYLPRKIALPKEPGTETGTVTIGENHLDSNRHVNNGQYLRFVMNTLPDNTLVTGLRIEYRMQAHLGDCLHIVRFPADTFEADPEKTGAAEKAVTPADGEGKILTALTDEEGKAYAVLELYVRERAEKEKDAWIR